MNYKNLLNTLEFSPKENSSDIFFKEYQQADNYCIEIDFGKESIYYGDKIRFDNATTQNFSKQENFVMLECVDRLLSTGYKPESIFLEKAYPAGRGVTKYLDILVYQEDKPYLMIECKTYGEQFNNELKKIQKDGGQLFTYFQQDTKTKLLMLYASDLVEDKIVSEYKIIKIEEEFRSAGNVENVFKLWKGIFDELIFWESSPYDNSENEKFTKNNLRELNKDEGQALFNKFATILRKHSVSDKPNAFNKIFNLFLAKLYDEQKKPNQELEFHWRENDNPVDFQVRLFNLHKNGLKVFLEKELAGIYDTDFDGVKSKEELLEKKKNVLKINKICDIKEVFDDDTFEQNHRVLKEVVQLIEKYRIRYPRKQQHLSDFFEQLLTTGLKQEAGQYFTPPTITKFIIKSLPLPEMLEKEINQPAPSLPAAIDYAAGSGHFITEILEEYQNIIETFDTSDFYPQAQNEVASWKASPYNWAVKYVYGIEKDYRLVKVAKVGCYFYGDGLAQIVLGDGLDSFEKSKSYVGLLKENVKKPQFSVLVSNPPYSVDYCKDDLEYIGSQNEFKLYKYLTDSSDNVECLFVERTAQLLKDGGIAGIVLPSSILNNNEPIYIKTREIILQYFDIVAITELGSNTFMATGTNTVVLFLRKRNENDVEKIKTNVYNNLEHYKKTKEERVTNGIEKPMSKYLEHTEETEIDHEKFYYFVLNYWQKTVIVKTGKNEEEKEFLGYKISKTKGKEGMHSIQLNKSIEQCTKLFDEKSLNNTDKASTYIYSAFLGNYDLQISENLKNNVSKYALKELILFNLPDFNKNILTSEKQGKIEIKSKYTSIRLGDDNLVKIEMGNSAPQDKSLFENGKYPFIRTADVGNAHLSINLTFVKDYLNEKGIVGLKKFRKGTILIPKSGASTYLNHRVIMGIDGYVAAHLAGIIANEEIILTNYLFAILSIIKSQNIKPNSDYPSLNKSDIENIKIPLPPKDIQKIISREIEVLFEKSKTYVIPNMEEAIEQILEKYL